MSHNPELRWSIVFAGALGAGVISPAAHAVTGAELIRNTPHRHGRFEARLMFAPGDGIVSSLFLWKLGSELPGTYWNEIDIEKVGADCRGYSSNAIFGAPAAHDTQRIGTERDLCDSYHTHAIEWTPERLVWLLDGVEVRRLGAEAVAAFEQNASMGMQIRFNVWVGDASFGGSFSPASLPARQYIEWVAYSSLTPGAGPGGSDFTPVWREDFDAPLGSQWSYGTWSSPLGLSTHSPQNVTLASGVAVLSLSDDAAAGYSGTPPVDSNGSAGAGASGGGAAGSAGAGSGAAGPSGSGAAGPSGSAGSAAERPRSGAGCGVASPRPVPRWLPLGILLAGLGLLRRQRGAPVPSSRG